MNRANVNNTTLQRNIKFIAESLAKYIYNQTNINLEIFRDYFSINPYFIENWLDILTSESRYKEYKNFI